MRPFWCATRTHTHEIEPNCFEIINKTKALATKRDECTYATNIAIKCFIISAHNHFVLAGGRCSATMITIFTDSHRIPSTSAFFLGMSLCFSHRSFACFHCVFALAASSSSFLPDFLSRTFFRCSFLSFASSPSFFLPLFLAPCTVACHCVSSVSPIESPRISPMVPEFDYCLFVFLLVCRFVCLFACLSFVLVSGHFNNIGHVPRIGLCTWFISLIYCAQFIYGPIRNCNYAIGNAAQPIQRCAVNWLFKRKHIIA